MTPPVWHHEVPGAFNLRELGGYPVGRGEIAPGRVYRCDLLHRVDPAAATDWLQRRRITRLVDLRTVGEREGDGFVEARDGLDVVHLGLLDEVWSWRTERDEDRDDFLRDRTVEILDTFADRIGAVLGLIADAPDGVLFHCTAGKDRTGVVAASLLGMLGAERSVIIEDYAQSRTAMLGIVDWYRSRMDPPPEDPPDEAELTRLVERSASPATMAGVLDEIDRRHGGFVGWANDHGLDDTLPERLVDKLVVPRTAPRSGIIIDREGG
ncbi:MAG: tyrosine-protein phosphatase [Microthrixaceae bacterium]